MVGWWRFPHSFQTYTFLPFGRAAILVMLEGTKQFFPKRSKRLEIVPLSHPLGMDQPKTGKAMSKKHGFYHENPWNAKVSCKFAHDPSWEAWKICIMCDMKNQQVHQSPGCPGSIHSFGTRSHWWSCYRSGTSWDSSPPFANLPVQWKSLRTERKAEINLWCQTWQAGKLTINRVVFYV